jgi:hypothetical protein
MDSRELGDQFVRHAVGEVILVGVTGKVLERQHGNRFYDRGPAYVRLPEPDGRAEENQDGEPGNRQLY